MVVAAPVRRPVTRRNYPAYPGRPPRNSARGRRPSLRRKAKEGLAWAVRSAERWIASSEVEGRYPMRTQKLPIISKVHDEISSSAGGSCLSLFLLDCTKASAPRIAAPSPPPAIVTVGSALQGRGTKKTPPQIFALRWSFMSFSGSMITVAIAGSAVGIVISVSSIPTLAESQWLPAAPLETSWGVADPLGIWTDESDTPYVARQMRPFNPSARVAVRLGCPGRR
jgi:hypothetical protein